MIAVMMLDDGPIGVRLVLDAGAGGRHVVVDCPTVAAADEAAAALDGRTVSVRVDDVERAVRVRDRGGWWAAGGRLLRVVEAVDVVDGTDVDDR